MVILMLSPPTLSPGFTHDASDYQIATDPLFTDDSIVKEVLGDTTNKLIKTFDLDLDPAIKYYARARYVLNKFIAEWSNVDIIVAKDVTDLNLHADIPSIVSIPTTTLNYDLENLPTTFFTINTSEIATTSNATHLFTTYLITDTNGNIYLSNLEDNENLTEYKVYKEKLPENKTCILYVQHGSSSGDISEFSKVVFKTTSMGDIDIISNTKVVKDVDLLIKLAVVDNVSEINVSLYGVDKTDNSLLTNISTDVFSFTISKDYYIDNVNDYMLSIQYKYTDDTLSPIRYVPIETYV